MKVEELALWGTFFSGLGALAALLLSINQVRRDSKFNEANFWLSLREMFHHENRRCVHNDFRDGKWKDDKPSDTKDWVKIEEYLGLFEICERMLQRRVISRKMFKSIYEYRLYNFTKNKEVVKCKLIYEPYDWIYLYKLLSRIYGREWNDMLEFLQGLKIDYNEISSEKHLVAKMNDVQKTKYDRLKTAIGI
ncbi:hypothetical protein [Flavobacterium sp.]|uniref:hypothetical protein n=1 Tax=Flavobacterium sp. TaxID=239 RepID=UPI0012078B8A|nr:hypothetical protein [Flavobacterium sp.]RZJ72567.1 MAG: hypothetical protein EOO49_06555 [Flavobacterium sp.]